MNLVPFSALKLDIAAALSRPPPPPDDVLPGLPVGAVGALVAPGGAGKTMLALGASVGLATGMPSVSGLEAQGRGLSAAPAPVVLVTAEESVDEMHRRLHRVVAALFPEKGGAASVMSRSDAVALLEQHLRVYPLSGRARIRLDDESSASLQALTEAAAGARLVILDPLRQFHSQDENDSWAMTDVVQKLQRIAHRNRCAVIVSHHTSKHATMNGLGGQAGASRGSAALTDAVRWQLNLSRLDDSLAKLYGIQADDLERHLRVDLAKANYAEPQAPIVMRKEAGGVLVRLEPKLKSLRRKA